MATEKTSSVNIGILLTLISALCYALQSAVIKGHYAVLPLPVIVFVQSLWALILLIVILMLFQRTKIKSILTTKNLKLQIFRSVASLGISYLLFFSLKFIPLADGVLLANASPLMVPFLAWIFFRQPINHKLWLPLILGFIGVMAVLKPSAGIFNPASFFALGAGLSMASSMLLVRRLSTWDSTLTSLFYYFFLSSIISGIVMLFFLKTQNNISIAFAHIPLMLLVGSLFFVVQYFLTKALEYTNAQIVSIAYYSCVIFAVILGWILFAAKLDWLIMIGIILICGSGIACIQVQTSEQRKRVG